MHAGFAGLKLSPRQFWSLTPRELQAALQPPHGATATAPVRSELAALLKRFPDGQEASDG